MLCLQFHCFMKQLYKMLQTNIPIILKQNFKTPLSSNKTHFNNALATDESTQTIQTLAPLGDYPIKGTITGNYD